MAQNYSKAIENQLPYLDVIEEIEFAYMGLYVNSFSEKESASSMLRRDYYLIEKPAVFFRPKLNENSKEYLQNVAQFENIISKLIQAHPKSELNDLYTNCKDIFLEALKYGLEFVKSNFYIEKFIKNMEDTEAIYNSLLNLACATVESASYFESATTNLDYNDPKTHEILDYVQELYYERLNNANFAQSYANFNIVNNGKQFVEYYNNLKEAQLSVDDIYSCIQLNELNKLRNDLVLDYSQTNEKFLN